MNSHDTRPCEPFRHDLGAYVLGGLEPDEQRGLEEHLADCAACRVEHDELTGLPPLLDLTRTPGQAVPSRVRDRVVAAAARRHARRRWALATAAAALVAALGGVGVGMQLTTEPAPTLALPLQSMEPFEDASGWATVRASDDGLVVALDLWGLPPLSEPEIYEAWLYRHDERIVSIGQLEVSDGVAKVELTVAGDLSDYRGFWITAEPDRRDPAHEGPTVLRAPLPDSL